MPKPAPVDKSTLRVLSPMEPGCSSDGQPFRTGASPRSPCSPTFPVPTARMPVEAYSKEYNMNHKRRGLAVIFNNETFDDEELPKRRGSSVDVIDLVNTFTLLGFETIVHPDLTRSEISEELKKLAKTNHDDCDAFCVIVLSHGDSPDLLYARDAVYRQSELWEPFISRRCLSLAGKPKLFFIQACRGKQYEKNTLLLKDGPLYGTHIDSMTNWSYVIPSRVDFLVSQSTCAGFCAHRNPNLGSWFIQSLCEVLNAEHTKTDLLKMLTIVHRQVVIKYESFVEGRPDRTGLKETPTFTSTLMRDVYFHPKPKPVSSAESDSPEADQSEENPQS